MSGYGEKSVFISYRRINGPWALVVRDNLASRGYDVFLDHLSLGNGDFCEEILEHVRARAHFLVILAPSSLERTSDPLDVFGMEISEAIRYKRNVVPLFLEGFNYGMLSSKFNLPPGIGSLVRYNGLPISLEFFHAAIEKLCQQYLRSVPDSHPQSISDKARVLSDRQANEVLKLSRPDEARLRAQQWFERSFAVEDPAERVRVLSEALLNHPWFPEALLRRANARLHLQDLAGARADLDSAIQQDPSLSLAISQLGNWWRKVGRLDMALQVHERAVACNPKESQCYVNRGVVKRDLGDLDGALRDFDRAIELDRESSIAYNNRGTVLSKLGDVCAAERDYAKALELDPAYAMAYFNRGNLRYQLGRKEDALEDLNRAVQLDPQPEALTNRGVVRSALNDVQGALDDFNAALGENPSLSEALVGRANIKFRAREFVKALIDLNAAIKLDDTKVNAWVLRGMVLRELGDRAGAEADLERAQSMDPTRADIAALRESLEHPYSS